jgi:hypothetical protein
LFCTAKPTGWAVGPEEADGELETVGEGVPEPPEIGLGLAGTDGLVAGKLGFGLAAPPWLIVAPPPP